LVYARPPLPAALEQQISANRIHEIKHDGFRIMARRDGAGVRLFSRLVGRLT
jgi:ATP-dependent DNA ligase